MQPSHLVTHLITSFDHHILICNLITSFDQVQEGLNQSQHQSLPQSNFSSLSQICDQLRLMEIPNKETVISKFVENQNRDEDDQLRCIQNYGDVRKKDKEMLHQVFDVVIDVTGFSAEENFQRVWEKIQKTNWYSGKI
eukprot:TRINITY_DN10878_c0_g1_i1.p1 TRINITY_DN10878_c0_g1~~TRINITY_DN10878_c0_g1_i1.p1  ORF type:complete len:138 (+),score=25.50 TRINITY_DN10878_c0_g1_i1:160-573(+)